MSMINTKAKSTNNAKALPKDSVPLEIDGSLFDWRELDSERASEYAKLKAHACEIIESLRPIHDAMYQLRLDTAAEYRAAKTGDGEAKRVRAATAAQLSLAVDTSRAEKRLAK